MYKFKIKNLFFLFLMFFSINIHAKDFNCWDYAASKFNLDPWLLFAIGSVESSFNEGISSKNSNNTYDLGLMQINSIHIPYFQRMGLNRNDLQNDTCKNIIAAAHLLRQSINKYGYNIDGIGGYHSNTPRLRRNYGQKVINHYNTLVDRYHVKGEHFSFESYNKRNRNNTVNYNNYSNNHYNQRVIRTTVIRKPLVLTKTASNSK